MVKVVKKVNGDKYFDTEGVIYRFHHHLLFKVIYTIIYTFQNKIN
jgi:hypothetical protein